jgi:tetratricopeptide (TPR) repeat protein
VLVRRFKYCYFVLLSIFVLVGCASTDERSKFAGLIQASINARSVGHEDLAANDLKESYELLPPEGDPKRVQAVNQLYPEIIELARELGKSGRFSLSHTMYDKAIEIEKECTIAGKPSATALKQESEKVFDSEEKILDRAASSNDLTTKEKQLRSTSDILEKRFEKGEYQAVEIEAKKHLEVVRAAFGTASPQYDKIRRVVIGSQVRQDKFSKALDLLNRDEKELDTFTMEGLKNADEDAVQNALFLSTTLCSKANLETIVGPLNEAERHARRSLELVSTLGGTFRLEKALSDMALANVLSRKGGEKEALDLARDAQKMLETISCPKRDRIYCLSMICRLEDKLGQKQQAQGDFTHLLKQVSASPELAESTIAYAYAAAFNRARGDEASFSKLKEKALASVTAKGQSKIAAQAVFETLGDSSFHIRQFSEALDFYSKAMPYSSNFQMERIKMKVEDCKKRQAN